MVLALIAQITLICIPNWRTKLEVRIFSVYTVLDFCSQIILMLIFVWIGSSSIERTYERRMTLTDRTLSLLSNYKSELSDYKSEFEGEAGIILMLLNTDHLFTEIERGRKAAASERLAITVSLDLESEDE